MRDTLSDIVIEVDLTETNRMVGFRLLDVDRFGDKYFWGDKLSYVLREPLAQYDDGCIKVRLMASNVERTLRWESNVDMDGKGQILGIEVLFAENILPPEAFDRVYPKV